MSVQKFTSHRVIAPADMQKLFDSVSNWGRWGAEDERGCLNHLTPTQVAKAAALIQSGRTVSLARNFPTQPGPENPWPAQHHMLIGGDDCCVPGVPGLEVATDFIGIAFHGMASSHLDALCHVFAQQRMYNGLPATDVKSTGARRNTVMTVANGIVGRGVLLDIPKAQGKPYIDPQHMVTVAEIEEAEKAQGVRVEQGDIVLVRIGRDPFRAAHPETQDVAGLEPEIAAWLHKREAAVLGGDGVHDPIPSGRVCENWPMPIHMCGLAAMGLHLLDNLNLEDVAEACAQEQRHAFFLSIGALRIEGGTGSPVNPIAVF